MIKGYNQCLAILLGILILFSFLFRYWSKKNTAIQNQLTFLLLGLLIIIITLKCVPSYQEKENFDNDETQMSTQQENGGFNDIQNITATNFKGLQKIIAYLKGIDEEDINKEQTKKMLDNLKSQFNNFDPEKLDNQLTQISSLLQNLQDVSQLTKVPEPTESNQENILENRSIQESQFLQDVEIKNLENEISQLQNEYVQYLDKEENKNYKKIPVYSSCVMEANGTLSSPSNYGVEGVQTTSNLGASFADDTANRDPLQNFVKMLSENGINISLVTPNKEQPSN